MLSFGLFLKPQPILPGWYGLRPGDGPVIFGDANVAGEAAVPVFLADGEYGSFSVTSGMLAPRVPVAAGTYLAGGFTIVVEAKTRVLATSDELQAVLDAGGAAMAGITHKLRPGFYDAPTLNGRLGYFSAPVTFTSVDPNSLAVLEGWIMASYGAVQGNFALEDLAFFSPQNPENHNYVGPPGDGGRQIVNIGNCQDVAVRRCFVYSDQRVAVEGGYLTEAVCGIKVGRSAVRIALEDNVITHLTVGAAIEGVDVTLRGNEIRHVHADFVLMGNGLQNFRAVDNFFHSPVGAGNMLHQDFFQFTPNGTQLTQNNVIEGNILLLGDGPTLARGAAPEGASANVWHADTVALGKDTALTVANHADKVMTTSTAGVWLTLPSAKEAAGHSFIFQVTGAGSFVIEGADTHVDGLWPCTVDAATFETGTWAIWSNGTQWETRPKDFRSWSVYRRGDWTLGPQDQRKDVVIDASDGDCTLTLSADIDACAVKRWKPVGGTITIVPGPGQTLTLEGNPVGKIVVDDMNDCFALDRTGSAWAATYSILGMQGMIGNPDANFGSMTVRHNIIESTQYINMRFNGTVEAEVFAYNNTAIKAYPSAMSGGLRDARDGWDKTAAGTWVWVTGPGAAAVGNISATVVNANDGAVDEGNVELGIDLADKDDLSAMRSEFPNYTGNPKTKADALAQLAGAASGVGHAQYWDFDKGAIRADAPAPKLVGTTPDDGAAIGADDSVLLNFDQLIYAGAGVPKLVGELHGAQAVTVSPMQKTLIITPHATLPSDSYTLSIPADVIEGMYDRPLEQPVELRFDVKASKAAVSNILADANGSGDSLAAYFDGAGHALSGSDRFDTAKLADPGGHMPGPKEVGVWFAETNLDTGITGLGLRILGDSTINTTLRSFNVDMSDNSVVQASGIAVSDCGVIDLGDGWKRLWIRADFADANRYFLEWAHTGSFPQTWRRPGLFVTTDPAVAWAPPA